MAQLVRRLHSVGVLDYKCRPSVYMAARRKSRRNIRDNIVPCADSSEGEEDDADNDANDSEGAGDEAQQLVVADGEIKEEQLPDQEEPPNNELDDVDVMSVDTLVLPTKEDIEITMMPIEVIVPSVQESFFHFFGPVSESLLQVA
eukprot:c18567_g1_i2.p1 GENE.c18567_g1_i2~~c18567_g1_i2.p1  ORF type:complete len:145 (-),score=27.05 c18567_g1_i2:482-916(-)